MQRWGKQASAWIRVAMMLAAGTSMMHGQGTAAARIGGHPNLNGIWQAMKIAACAEAHEVNIAPHNFYGHLANMMNAHFAAAVPNLRIMEIDIDRIAADSEIFPHPPRIENGYLILPDTPGWGCDPNEAAIRARPLNAIPQR